jgi:DNA modification methylase
MASPSPRREGLMSKNKLPIDTPTFPEIVGSRLCDCPPTHINCMTAKEWLKSQLGVWEFYYERRDIRDKELHPATFPISLATQVIRLLSHRGELVLDPFVGSGTTLVAAQDLDRNAVGFDLQEKYITLSQERLKHGELFNKTRQLAISDDARSISNYLRPDSVGLIVTSPPYANLLNRKRKNKSRRNRDNGQLGKVEQYSQVLATLERLSWTTMQCRWVIFSRGFCHS